MLSLVEHFIFGMVVLMVSDKLSATYFSRRPHIHLYRMSRRTGEELKNACYSFTTVPSLPRKCLIDFCQHTYETKDNKNEMYNRH
jgi:hypothetical protein